MKKLVIALILFIFAGCSNEKGNTLQIPEDISDGISVSNVANHSLDTLLLSQLNTDIFNGMYGNIHSLLIMKDDELIVEQYYNEGERDEIHFLASVSKGFVAILVGIAVDKGFIDSINRPMLDYFPEYKKVEKDSRKHKVTIEHLLTMTSGFEWDESTLPFSDPNNDGVRMDAVEDKLDASLKLKMDTLPGTKYVYCGPNDIILGEIIKKSSGQNIEEFAVKNLFRPLQINEYRWSSNNGVYHTGGGLWMKSRGMLKFGQLLLNDGNIGEMNLISKTWVDKTFAPQIEMTKPFYMGYQWRSRMSESGIHSNFVSGNGGQLIVVFNELNIVLVVTADNRGRKQPLGELVERVLKIHQSQK
jgi:CubicO group peptidase (beta-lactamase class C family)